MGQIVAEWTFYGLCSMMFRKKEAARPLLRDVLDMLFSLKKLNQNPATHILAGLALASLASIASANPLENVSGVWLTEAKTGHVEISDCGDGTPCGLLIWAESEQTDSVPKDINNKDSELRTRPLIGIKMIYGFELKKEEWKSGKIYNAKDGKTYKASLKRLDEDTLQVKGCVGPICKKQIWTRLSTENAPS